MDTSGYRLKPTGTNVKLGLPVEESPRAKLNVHTWAWDIECINDTSTTTRLSNDNRLVSFHPGYSSGTSAVRGNTPFVAGRDYFWEIKMLTTMYGTDVMVGVGTAKVELSKDKYTFTSLLGQDKESWGFSYNGALQHNGKWLGNYYGGGFNYGDIVGVHLDMWNGSLSFYINGLPLGVAYKSLNGQVLYPMVCSTAAWSSMELIYSYSCSSSLQQLCLRSLSTDNHLMSTVSSVPGLRDMPEKVFLDFQYVQSVIPQVEKDIMAPVSDDEAVETTLKHRFRKRKRKFALHVPITAEMQILTEADHRDRGSSMSNTENLGADCTNCGAICRFTTNLSICRTTTRLQNRLCNNCTFIL